MGPADNQGLLALANCCEIETFIILLKSAGAPAAPDLYHDSRKEIKFSA